MSRHEIDRLRDISDAARAIADHVSGARARPGGLEDPLVHDALLYQFIVIGEAVKAIEPATRARAANVPWEEVAGLRDLIAHEYFHIDITLILEIVERDLPGLAAAVEGLIADDAAERD